MTMTATPVRTSANRAAALSRPAQLLLARLLLAKSPAKAQAVQKQLELLIPNGLSADEFSRLHHELQSAGLLEPKPPKKQSKKQSSTEPASATHETVTTVLKLNEQGTAAALALLGAESLPAKMTWKSLLDLHLFPLAAGISPDDHASRQRLRKAPQLAAFLVKQHYNMESAAADTLPKLLDALVFKVLGYPQISDWPSLKSMVLSRLIGSTQSLPVAEIAKQLPRIALGVPSTTPDELRKSAIRKWVDQNPTPSGRQPEATEPAKDSPPAFGLPAFAQRVKAVAAASPGGWFGDNKVFINHVWQQYQQGQPENAPTDLAAFKERLVEANRAGLLHLSRADLVAAMDARDVRDSQTHYLNAEFHFILVEGKQP